jgi:5-formyltetrahydrofolate cyclo-ligase
MTGKPRIPRGDAAVAALRASEASEKAQLRNALLAARRAIDPAMRSAWDAAIGARVQAWWHASRPAVLGVYWPLRGEPDLHAAYAALAAQGAALALPVVLQPDAPLAFAAWVPGEAMVKDAMGVAVPAALRPLARPPALLVPCLGFNAAGYRLGYGGGYYDRTLEAAPRALAVGIAYSCLAADFASAPHDVALDLVITECT